MPRKPKIVKLTRKELVEQNEFLKREVQRRNADIENNRLRIEGMTARAAADAQHLREQNKSLSDQVASYTARAVSADMEVRKTEAELKRARAEAKRSARALHILTESTYEG